MLWSYLAKMYQRFLHFERILLWRKRDVRINISVYMLVDGIFVVNLQVSDSRGKKCILVCNGRFDSFVNHVHNAWNLPDKCLNDVSMWPAWYGGQNNSVTDNCSSKHWSWCFQNCLGHWTKNGRGLKVRILTGFENNIYD